MSRSIVPDPQLQCSQASRDEFERGTTLDQREKMYPPLSPQGENDTREERNIVMPNVMKPPEYATPAYPNYAPVPGASQQPRKPYRWVRITLGILALVCVIGGVLLIGGIGSTITAVAGPTIAGDQYYHAIKDLDYARAYIFLGSGVKTRLSHEAFTQQAQEQDAAYGSVSTYSYANVQIGDQANATLTVTRDNGISYTVHMRMNQEGGAWKITSFDRI